LATGPGGGMFGSAGKTPAANGGIRGGSRDDDDDDEDDEDKARFMKSDISLEQVSFLIKVKTKLISRHGGSLRSRYSELGDLGRLSVYIQGHYMWAV
jgi:hypothetical protein